MSYDALEASRDDGRAFFLYAFDRAGVVTRFCSLDRDVSAMGETFTASALQHDQIRTGNTTARDVVEITFPATDAFAQGYRAPVGSALTSVTIWRSHFGDGEFRVVYLGRVRASRPGSTEIVLVCSSVLASAGAPGPRGRTGNACDNVLYDGAAIGCTLTFEAFAVPATVTAVSGDALTIPVASAAGDDEYTGGRLRYGLEEADILSQTGETVRLFALPAGLADAVSAGGSAAVEIAPGCNRSRERCAARFANIVNHAGQRIPAVNRFRQGLI